MRSDKKNAVWNFSKRTNVSRRADGSFKYFDGTNRVFALTYEDGSNRYTGIKEYRAGTIAYQDGTYNVRMNGPETFLVTIVGQGFEGVLGECKSMNDAQRLLRRLKK